MLQYWWATWPFSTTPSARVPNRWFALSRVVTGLWKAFVTTSWSRSKAPHWCRSTECCRPTTQTVLTHYYYYYYYKFNNLLLGVIRQYTILTTTYYSREGYGWVVAPMRDVLFTTSENDELRLDNLLAVGELRPK